MKRIIAFLLSLVMIFTGCAANSQSEINLSQESIDVYPQASTEETITPSFDTLESEGLLDYVEDSMYSQLVDSLDPESYFVESVKTKYISKEYLEETEYNSKENIFFGYNISELNEEFLGTKYVFTLDNGKTTVTELELIEKDVYGEMIKDVAVGSGIILISVSVAVVTKNPAAAVSAGKTVKLIFAVSSTAAKAGTALALESATLAGFVGGIAEAIRTGDIEMIMETSLSTAAEGFKLGAIAGTVEGIAKGIKILKGWRYFPEGTPQAKKYAEGVKYTKGPNGMDYPRFEKWAKKTVKFDLPTQDNLLKKTCLTGNYTVDARKANIQAGFSSTPAGYVWHHVEDMQTMILVPQDLHSIAMGGMWHSGGASLIRKALNIAL